MDRFDVILVGGGLQNGLIALAVLHHRPETRLALVERANRLGGNHTWCFFESDVPGGATAWIDTLIVHQWPTRSRERAPAALPAKS